MWRDQVRILNHIREVLYLISLFVHIVSVKQQRKRELLPGGMTISSISSLSISERDPSSSAALPSECKKKQQS